MALEAEPSAEGAGGRWSVVAQHAQVPARSDRCLWRWSVAEVLALLGFTMRADRPHEGAPS